MSPIIRKSRGLFEWLHGRFLFMLVAAYVAAALVPAWGLALRNEVGVVAGFGWSISITPSLLLLAALLGLAGLATPVKQVCGLYRHTAPLLAGVATNLLAPLVLLGFFALLLAQWHNDAEAQSLFVGLAVIAAMPIAGSSAGWAQHANGNLALSLGLVLGSTLLSPLSTPAIFHLASQLTSGSTSEELHTLAGDGTGLFLVAAVVAPSISGLLLRQILGEGRCEAMRPELKAASTCILLTLCYSNAATCLPYALAVRDWDFLFATMIAVTLFCFCSFAAGVGLARFLRSDDASRASLTFGLGMNNNGTGQVLASLTLAANPPVLLPILGYNLMQHLAAGAVERYLRRPT